MPPFDLGEQAQHLRFLRHVARKRLGPQAQRLQFAQGCRGFSALRPTMITVALACPSARAMPRPMPPLPPVTSAILSLRSNMAQA